MRKLLIAISLLILLPCTVAIMCGAIPRAPRTNEELVGKYILDWKYSHEELELHADGTFTQKVFIKNTGELAWSRGRWKYRLLPTRYFSGSVDLFGGYLNTRKWPEKFNEDYKKQGGTTIATAYWFGTLVIGMCEDCPEWKRER